MDLRINLAWRSYGQGCTLTCTRSVGTEINRACPKQCTIRAVTTKAVEQSDQHARPARRGPGYHNRPSLQVLPQRQPSGLEQQGMVTPLSTALGQHISASPALAPEPTALQAGTPQPGHTDLPEASKQGPSNATRSVHGRMPAQNHTATPKHAQPAGVARNMQPDGVPSSATNTHVASITGSQRQTSSRLFRGKSSQPLDMPKGKASAASSSEAVNARDAIHLYNQAGQGRLGGGSASRTSSRPGAAHPRPHPYSEPAFRQAEGRRQGTSVSTDQHLHSYDWQGPEGLQPKRRQRVSRSQLPMAMQAWKRDPFFSSAAAPDKLALSSDQRQRLHEMLRQVSRSTQICLYKYGLDDWRLYRALRDAGLLGRVAVVESVSGADAVLAVVKKRTGKQLSLVKARSAAANAGLPLIALPTISGPRLLQALAPLLGLAGTKGITYEQGSNSSLLSNDYQQPIRRALPLTRQQRAQQQRARELQLQRGFVYIKRPGWTISSRSGPSIHGMHNNSTGKLARQEASNSGMPASEWMYEVEALQVLLAEHGHHQAVVQAQQAASEVHALEAAVQLALRSGSASLLSPPLQAFSPLEHDAMLDVLNMQTASMPSTKLALKPVNLHPTKCMADDEAGQSGMIGPSAEFASAPPAAKLVPLPLRHGSRVARRKYRQDQAELKAKW